MTSQGIKRAVNFGLSGHGAGKYFKMATIESECFEVLSRLLEIIQTDEETLARVHSGCIIPKISAAVSSLCQILRGEVGVLVVNWLYVFCSWLFRQQ